MQVACVDDLSHVGIGHTLTGTPCWLAPEVIESSGVVASGSEAQVNEDGYDAKADIWSFGITAMELAYGRAPYARFQPMKVLLYTLERPPPTCEIFQDNSYHFSKSFHSMIEKCLVKDPHKR